MAAHPVLTFQGDDFTDFTNVIEALASNDVDTTLFLYIPTVIEIQAARGVDN